MTQRVKGLYALTPDQLDTDKLLRISEQALSGGVSVLQYRNKIANASLRREQTKLLRQLCNQYNTLFIINDHIDLVTLADADGVHIGAEDISVLTARQHLGRDKIIGASCYNQMDLAIAAVHESADYVAFGSFFSSATKPDATAVSIDFLAKARCQISVPVVAIGGIDLQNAADLIRQDCDAIAVCGALFHQPNIMASAQQFCRLFTDKDGDSSNAVFN